MEKRDLKRTRINAIVIGSLLCLTLISFVYAFVQQSIAKANLGLAIQFEAEKQEFRERLEHCEQQAQIEAKRADEALARITGWEQSKKK